MIRAFRHERSRAVRRAGTKHKATFCRVASVLFVVGCQAPCPATAEPRPPPGDCGLAPANGATGATANTRIDASIMFVENGPDILKWDFLVRGLPALDSSTGSIVVADLSRGYIASSLGLSLRWLGPGQKRPVRVLPILDEHVASTILYERDGDATGTAALAHDVRARIRDANQILGALDLHPTIPCAVEVKHWCDHPQRLLCSDLSADLHGDALAWRLGAVANETILGWSVPPMPIGGVAQEMIPCALEAHFEPVTKLIAARVETYCKEPGGDSCILPGEWRIISLR